MEKLIAWLVFINIFLTAFAFYEAQEAGKTAKNTERIMTEFLRVTTDGLGTILERGQVIAIRAVDRDEIQEASDASNPD